MNGKELFSALGGIGDDLVAAAGERMGYLRIDADSLADPEEVSMHTRKAKKISTTALIAAAAAVLLAISALAAVYATSVRRTNGLEGVWGGTPRVYMKNARTYVTFESDAPRHAYQFKANWLPSAPTVGAQGEYTDYLSNDGEGAILPYVINSYNRIDIQGIRYCFDGKETLIKQDMWNGYERTEIVVDYTDTPHSFTTVNYLILFQPEDNYLVYIGGTDSMETMEKIVENLEIKVGGELTEFYDAGSDIAWFDLGRG